MNFSDIIKSLRKDRRLKQSELADVVGVTAQAVSKWETSGSEPDIAAIVKLCDYFNVSADYLLGRTEWPEFVWRDADGNPADDQPEPVRIDKLSKSEVGIVREMLKEYELMKKQRASIGE